MEFQKSFFGEITFGFHSGSLLITKWINVEWINLKFNLGERNMNKRSCRDKDKIFFVTKIHFSLVNFSFE